jgi:hypothetical protein
VVQQELDHLEFGGAAVAVLCVSRSGMNGVIQRRPTIASGPTVDVRPCFDQRDRARRQSFFETVQVLPQLNASPCSKTPPIPASERGPAPTLRRHSINTAA